MKSAMMSALLLASAPLLSPSAALAAGSPVTEHVTPAVKAEIMASIDAWRTALIKLDRAGLERAYHDDLSYGHSDGVLENKKSQIDRTIVPDRTFPQVDVSNMVIRAYGNTAYITATWTFHVKEKNAPERLSAFPGLDVWTRAKDGHWQLIARQLTK